MLKKVRRSGKPSVVILNPKAGSALDSDLLSQELSFLGPQILITHHEGHAEDLARLCWTRDFVSFAGSYKFGLSSRSN